MNDAHQAEGRLAVRLIHVCVCLDEPPNHLVRSALQHHLDIKKPTQRGFMVGEHTRYMYNIVYVYIYHVRICKYIILVCIYI